MGDREVDRVRGRLPNRKVEMNMTVERRRSWRKAMVDGWKWGRWMIV